MTKHYNRVDGMCKIIKTPCDNPQGCIGCYHQQVSDYSNYYDGTGPMPAEAHKRRTKKVANR